MKHESCIVYENATFNSARLGKIVMVNSVLTDFLEQGYVLSVRQLYYQLVTKNYIDNNIKEYGGIQRLVCDGRMAGLIPWDAIEDRGRSPKIPYSVDGVADALRDTVDAYRLNRQGGQSVYIEVWIEKDALYGVFSPVTKEYHIQLLSNRGYGSITSQRDSALRIRHALKRHEHAVILYFGDHDPSGKDMIRDIRKKMVVFGVPEHLFEIRNCALTMDQVKQFNLAPNPAKKADKRYKDYVAKYGDKCWELDAIHPRDLTQILTDEILKIINEAEFNKRLEEEKIGKAEIERLIGLFNN